MPAREWEEGCTPLRSFLGEQEWGGSAALPPTRHAAATPPHTHARAAAAPDDEDALAVALGVDQNRDHRRVGREAHPDDERRRLFEESRDGRLEPL
eukprot:3643900-Prymnesium_polylepis.1